MSLPSTTKNWQPTEVPAPRPRKEAPKRARGRPERSTGEPKARVVARSEDAVGLAASLKRASRGLGSGSCVDLRRGEHHKTPTQHRPLQESTLMQIKIIGDAQKKT